MSDHYPFAASAAHIWAHCPGAIAMQRAYPERGDDDEARQGTAAHWALAENLYGTPVPVGALDPAGTPVTEEMLEAVEVMREHLGTVLDRTTWPKMNVETKVHSPLIHEDAGGTPDVWVMVGSTLHIFDFKFGHRFVEVWRNQQLTVYAAGLVHAGWSRVCFHIVQPRCYVGGTVRTWEVEAAALQPLFDLLRASAYAATRADATCYAGDWCIDCRARHACPTVQAAGLAACSLSLKATPFDLTDAQAGFELEWLTEAATRLEARRSGLQAEIESRLAAGRAVPLWGMSPGQARERWTADPGAVFALGDVMGKDLRKPAAPITPAQARAAGIDAATVAALSERPRAPLKLTRINAQKVFGS